MCQLLESFLRMGFICVTINAMLGEQTQRKAAFGLVGGFLGWVTGAAFLVLIGIGFADSQNVHIWFVAITFGGMVIGALIALMIAEHANPEERSRWLVRLIVLALLAILSVPVVWAASSLITYVQIQAENSR